MSGLSLFCAKRRGHGTGGIAGSLGSATGGLVGRGHIAATDTTIGFRGKGGTLTERGVLASGTFSLPAAVSADGNTVLGATGTTGFRDAFIWTEPDELRTPVGELARATLRAAVGSVAR